MSTPRLPPLDHLSVVGMRVDATSYEDATHRVLTWARCEGSRYVCVATVHMVMEGHDAADFQEVVNSADLVTPDGVPLVWTLRRLGIKNQTRVYGPTLTLHVCEAAAAEGVPVGFYGATQETLDKLAANLQARFPGLDIAYAYAPPFRPLTEEEDDAIVKDIEASGARILFVGLGCPKQERWMAAHKGRIRGVMLGVGAAFDFHGGMVKQAPAWLQRMGLEWFFRLLMEPRRLWRRYLKHNPRYVYLAGLQVLGLRDPKESE